MFLDTTDTLASYSTGNNNNNNNNSSSSSSNTNNEESSHSINNSANSQTGERDADSVGDSASNTGSIPPPHSSSLGLTANEADEEEDLNIMRERELKDLKCKSVVEKMSVFFKYYRQFKDTYIQRVQTIECSDSLKMQFHSLIKYLNEYESLLGELDMMITEHERSHCKNNHRKTKKFFNKTKAFIRYECNKRLQSNIFEYRRLINSQDRYAFWN